MPHLLVSAEQLAAHPQWRIFDCRHDLSNLDAGAQAYQSGHIPGAIHLHLDKDLSGPKTGHNGRHPLPDRDAFAAHMAKLGVGRDTQVVAYDSQGGVYASRLWWMMRWIGHEQAAVLDGGIGAWLKSGFALSTEVPNFTSAQRSTNALDERMLVQARALLGNLTSRELQVVDARSAERFAGRNETLDPVAGHIPGAMNRFFQTNLDPATGCFKSPEALRSEFEAVLGATAADKVVHQCGSGVTACHNLLAMEVAGLAGSRLYPGSWSEWCSDPSRPIIAADSSAPSTP